MSTPSELLQRAAELAEQAADAATQGLRTIRIEGGRDSTGEGWSQISVDFGLAANPGTGPGCMLGDDADGELATGDAVLIAAAGPDFWRATAAMMRALDAAHPDAHMRSSPYCGTCARPEPCPSKAAALPLAERIIRDLEKAAAECSTDEAG